MNKEQTLVNNTTRAILALFEKFLTLWEGNEALEETINKLKAYQSGIDAAAYEQLNKSTEGMTVDKKQQKKLIVTLTLGIIAKVRPYAKRAGNNELLAAVDYSESDLTQVKEDLFISRCSLVANKGREFLNNLTAYKLTESELVALETAVEPFNNIIEKRHVTKGERVSATEKLDILVPLVRKELRILDDLVKSQMPDDFNSTYLNLR